MSALSSDLPSTQRPARRARPGWLPSIDPGRCTGCGWCVAACEPHVLALEAVQWKKRSVLQDAAACTGCSDCAVTCPFHAITMKRIAQQDGGGGCVGGAGPDEAAA